MLTHSRIAALGWSLSNCQRERPDETRMWYRTVASVDTSLLQVVVLVVVAVGYKVVS